MKPQATRLGDLERRQARRTSLALTPFAILTVLAFAWAIVRLMETSA